MRRIPHVAVAVFLLSALHGCADEAPDGPPQVRFGQAECVHCGMLVTDPRYAAAMVAEVEGKRREFAFDDIGDMLDYERQRRGLRVLRRYVGDHDTSEWVLAEQATYVRSPNVHTPMGSGLIAFADPGAAQRKLDESGGEILSYAQLTDSPQP